MVGGRGNSAKTCVFWPGINQTAGSRMWLHSRQMSGFRLRSVSRHANSTLGLRIPPSLSVWPLTLRRRTMGRRLLGVWGPTMWEVARVGYKARVGPTLSGIPALGTAHSELERIPQDLGRLPARFVRRP